MNYPKISSIIGTLILLILGTVPAGAQGFLQKAVSHNDYLQPRPLMDALEEGYVNIEADIFLHQHRLIVAHWFPYGKKEATLEKLYFLPLAAHIRNLQSSGAVIPQLTLLIDIKSSPEETYLELKKLLERYRWMLSSYHGSRWIQGPVTVVLTGRKPEIMVSREPDRLVVMDDVLNAPSKTPVQDAFTMASCKYSWVIRSRDSLTRTEKDKLRHWVGLAHRQGKKARLWASPENDRIRQDLLDCGIDLINTDHLKDLKRFLSSRENTQPLIMARYGQANP